MKNMNSQSSVGNNDPAIP